MRLPVLAIILPCYNEEAALPYTFSKMTSLLEQYIKEGLISSESRAYFINDGSSDATWTLIKNKAAECNLVSGISLSRNFGHQNALLAGLYSIEADVYITIDADLQDNPDCIREMLIKFFNGAEIVCGVRKKRDVDQFLKKHAAFMFYRIMNYFGVKTIPHHADFRLMSKKIVYIIRQFKERDIFLRGLVPYIGFKTECVYYDRTERQQGETKYPFSKLFALAWKGMSGFTDAPLRLITMGGLIFTAIGFLSVLLIPAYYFFLKLTAIFCFFTGIILIALGIIAEYIGKILMETKNRPSFIIEEKI